MKTAYIIVDVQNDFVEGGSLGVMGGKAAGNTIARFLREHKDKFNFQVATRDWHIDPGNHFDTWPVHCVADTPGANFTPEIQEIIDDQPTIIISKGLYSDGYSGFEGTNLNSRHLLDTILWDREVTDVVIGGIATDHCVRATALDAKKAGFNATVILDHSAGVAEDTTASAVQEMIEAGVVVTTEAEYIRKTSLNSK